MVGRGRAAVADEHGVQHDAAQGVVAQAHLEQQLMVVAQVRVDGVVVHEVAGRVQDRTAPVQLHAVEHVGAVSVDDLPADVDGGAGQAALAFRRRRHHVRSPVQRQHRPVDAASRSGESARAKAAMAAGSSWRSSQAMPGWSSVAANRPGGRRRPPCRPAPVALQSAIAGVVAAPREVGAGARVADAVRVEGGWSVSGQALHAEVEGVVVRQADEVDTARRTGPGQPRRRAEVIGLGLAGPSFDARQ